MLESNIIIKYFSVYTPSVKLPGHLNTFCFEYEEKLRPSLEILFSIPILELGLHSDRNLNSQTLVVVGKIPWRRRNRLPLQYSWASLVAQLVKNFSATQETWVRSLGWEDPLEKRKGSSILAWRIPWTV